MPTFKVTRTAKGHRHITEVVQRPRRDREILERAARAGLDPDDLVVEWLMARCTFADASAVPARELYNDFGYWGTSKGVIPPSQTAFGRRLAALGFGRDKRGPGARTRWIGLRLRVSSCETGGSEGLGQGTRLAPKKSHREKR